MRTFITVVVVLSFPAAALAGKDTKSTKPAASAKLAADTLCAKEEISFFACSTGKGKIVALCAPLDADSDHSIEYRFGTASKVELAYRGAWDRDFKYAFNPHQDSGEDHTVSFKNGKASYSVYQNEGPSGAFYGVSVDIGGKLTEVACKGEPKAARLADLQARMSSD